MAAVTRASWHRLAGFNAAHTNRSSHIVSTIPRSKQVLLYSGELNPREPVPAETTFFDLIAHKWRLTPVPEASSPPARCGAASATIADLTYIYGGRAGLAMAPVSENGVWEFDGVAERWTFLENAQGTDVPPHRSYHAMTSNDKDTLYLHAGCLEKGRLSDLWSYKPSTRVWTRLADAPEPARGGPTFAFLAATNQLVRYGGYNGKAQQGGTTDVYDIANGQWSTISPETGSDVPPSRSVSALVPVDNGRRLVLLFGEREASQLGHAGAGLYHEDAWVFDGRRWSQTEFTGAERPERRGWFAACPGLEPNEVLVSGGLNEANERLGDAWVLRFESFAQ